MKRMTLGLVALPLTLPAQAVAWPEPRSAHGMVWHAQRQETLLMGGAAGDSALWAWNGVRWRRAVVGGPADRGHFGFAYDAARNRLVVHGGTPLGTGTRAARLSGETWEWDKRTWRRVAEAGGPGKRDHHAMVYDPVRREVVLFGGSDSAGRNLADTWGWNGRSWRKLADDGPAARATHRMVFDVGRGIVMLYGGWGDSGVLNDTWEWNGERWQRAADGPPARFATRLAYDVARRRTVLFAGRGAADFSDTWEYDGRDWKRIEVAGPSERNVHALVYDPRARAVLSFGGFHSGTRFNDLWSFDGATWKQIPRPDARAPTGRYAARGPHTVGYRMINHWDSTRAVAPTRDFEGRLNASGRATPMQVSVWYPAVAGGTPMRRADYFAVSAKRETLTPVTEADIRAASQNDVGTARFQLGIELPPRIADSLAQLPVAAIRDARPAGGRFPLIVGALGGPSDGIAEYLASHGYVVVSTPDLGATATAQVNRPLVAIETATRNMEVIHGLARRLPYVDDTRLGLLGVNFGGLAALTHQMRNMSADAVVSLDGWELKAGTSSSLLSSPYYEPSRIRVPYLAFSQDNAPNPGLAFSDTVFHNLKYSTRYAYVIRDMEHAHLLSNLLPFPQLTAERRLGYDFVWRTVRAFFDANVKRDTAAAVFMARSAVENGYPAWLTKLERKDRAFAPIPTGEEVEQMAMRGEVEKLAGIYRRARSENPAVVVASVQTLNLFAFRFIRRGDTTAAIGFNELAHEMFPTSTHAANNLGNTYRDAGRMPRAIELWEKALTLIDADTDLPPADKAPSRTAIEGKIKQARP